MVSKRDLNSAEDHEDIEESDDVDDGQRRGANQRRNHGICQRIGLYSSKLCFLKKLPQFFLSGRSVRIMGIVTTGPAVKNHISPKRARELIAKLCAICSPWFICEFLYNAHEIPCLTKADTPKIQYPKEVEVRVRSCRKTWSINRQKPKTILKMKDTKKYRAIYCMTCWTGCRSSEKFWSMKVALWSHGETLRLRIKTMPVLLMNYQWSREQ